MNPTVFTNKRSQFETSTEGDNIILQGHASIGASGQSFNGQILQKDTQDYVGDYSETNISCHNMDYFIEAATLLTQLKSDINTKSEEEGA